RSKPLDAPAFARAEGNDLTGRAGGIDGIARRRREKDAAVARASGSLPDDTRRGGRLYGRKRCRRLRRLAAVEHALVRVGDRLASRKDDRRRNNREEQE